MRSRITKVGVHVIKYREKKYRYPRIEIRGRWIERAGIYTGNKVRVNVVDKFITIEAI